VNEPGQRRGGAPRSLQGRLLVLVLGAVTLLWAAAAVATWFDARHELDELLDAHLAQAAALLVARQAGGVDDEDGGVDTAPLHRYASHTAFQVWHEGRLVLRSSNAPATTMSPQPRGFATLDIDGTAWRVFGAHGGEQDVQVFVGEQTASRDGILWAVLRGMLGPLALALPVLALAVWWAVRRGLGPLRELGGTIAGRAPGSLTPVTLLPAPREMQPLIDALNQLFVRIGDLLAAERRFTADAAHELRTPIAAIRAQAQAALGAADDGERRHALAATLAGCDQATHLVTQLLLLSRLEASGESERTLFDLCPLARRVLAELAAGALARGQDLELEADAPCPVRGQDALIGMLLRNLVDNALRYSPDGARVLVRIQQRAVADGGAAVLSVEDSGPGLAEADLARLGERFFRVLGSGQSGSGLGWSIVRRIAAAQGVVVEVGHSAALGGLAVSLVFASTG
jgi:two-component system sensor histidine kinase QseC